MKKYLFNKQEVGNSWMKEIEKENQYLLQQGKILHTESHNHGIFLHQVSEYQNIKICVVVVSFKS